MRLCVSHYKRFKLVGIEYCTYAKMDGPKAIFCSCLVSLFERIKSNIGLASQSSKYAFRKQFLGPTFSARPNLDSGRLQYLSSQLYNKSNQYLANVQSWSCVTLASWRIRSRMSTQDFRNIYRISRQRSSTAVRLCKRISRSSPTKIRIPI